MRIVSQLNKCWPVDPLLDRGWSEIDADAPYHIGTLKPSFEPYLRYLEPYL